MVLTVHDIEYPYTHSKNERDTYATEFLYMHVINM